MDQAEVPQRPAQPPEEFLPDPPRPANRAQDPPRPQPEVVSRLNALGQWATDYRQRQGIFPTENPRAAELPPEARLGWLAELVAEREPAATQPLWDRPIDDALNGRFVRRRIPELLNPLIASSSADGYPATHFIGVAGVGADAPELPKQHPRAGIFGFRRATRPEDVRDGLANTLLIVGVERNLAPWASGGSRTIRGLTAEPYVRGPDGFGTGQPDGMHVAMADGSVRFLSTETAPVIFRRLAAMADGIALDPAVPGEPAATPAPHNIVRNEPPSVAPPEQREPASDEPGRFADTPILPLVAADRIVLPKPAYDVQRALQQPIRRFAQVRPARFLDLVRQVEELAGIPIDVNGLAAAGAAARLDREVSLELSDTTVEGILTALVERVGLSYETGREFGIRLTAPAF